jgi:hypothetical protein
MRAHQGGVGELKFTLGGVLEVRPLTRDGNVYKLPAKFGNVGQLRSAVNQLQKLLYAA